jgi:glycosyltransferase involved in cell wall biosynthesis
VRAGFATARINVLPTYREGFGNVLIEAAAMATPSVASRVTGCVDAVIDGVTGTLVPARSAPALVDAIARYLDIRSCAPAMGRQRAALRLRSSRRNASGRGCSPATQGQGERADEPGPGAR